MLTKYQEILVNPLCCEVMPVVDLTQALWVCYDVHAFRALLGTTLRLQCLDIDKSYSTIVKSFSLCIF
jgi:hypothetical protein